MDRGSIPEDSTDDRDALKELLQGEGERIQPGLQNTSERGWDAHAGEPRAVHGPLIVTLEDHSVIDQSLDQFFNVEGIAVGALDDQIAQLRRDLGHLLEQLSHQAPAGKL